MLEQTIETIGPRAPIRHRLMSTTLYVASAALQIRHPLQPRVRCQENHLMIGGKYKTRGHTSAGDSRLAEVSPRSAVPR